MEKLVFSSQIIFKNATIKEGDRHTADTARASNYPMVTMTSTAEKMHFHSCQKNAKENYIRELATLFPNVSMLDPHDFACVHHMPVQLSKQGAALSAGGISQPSHRPKVASAAKSQSVATSKFVCSKSNQLSTIPYTLGRSYEDMVTQDGRLYEVEEKEREVPDYYKFLAEVEDTRSDAALPSVIKPLVTLARKRKAFIDD